MDAGWLYVQDWFDSVGGFPSCLFDDVRHRNTLIEKTKLEREGGRERESSLFHTCY